MQTLWSRAARSNCTCRCLLCLNTARNGLIRRTPTAAGIRQIKLKDTIIAAYATIFIGGIIADKTRKDGKREEWDKKIAEVLEEVDVLRKRNDERTALAERPLASAVKKRISPRTQIFEQRRLYSTSQNAQSSDEVDDVSCDTVEDEVDKQAPPNDFDLNADLSYGYHVSPLVLQAVRTLSVQRLALKLILRPGIVQAYGQPDFFRSGGPHVLVPEFEGVLGQSAAVNIQQLLRKLSDTQTDLHLARTGRLSEERLKEIVEPSLAETQEGRNQSRPARESLDDELEIMFDDFFYGRIELKELLFQVATNLLQSPETPSIRTFEKLAHGFSKAMQRDLVRNVLDTLRECRVTLSSRMIKTVLLCFIRGKDLFSFNAFITWMRGKSKYSDYVEPWKTVVIGGREIAVPPRDDEKILRTLIYGALCFDQPHRAEMWLAILRRHGKDDHPGIWSAYLRYFTLISNWDEGRQVLSKAFKYLQSSSFDIELRSLQSPSFEIEPQNHNLEWTVFWMLSLCLRCGQISVYRRILDLAVGKGLRSTFTERELYRPSQEARKIALDWHDASRVRYGESSERRHQHPDAAQQDLFDDLELPSQETDDAEFSPKVKPVFNPLDQRAAFDARAAVLKSHTASTLPLRQTSDGVVLKHSILGYSKEDLDSDVLWNGPSIDSTTRDGDSSDAAPPSTQAPLENQKKQSMINNAGEIETPSTEPEFPRNESECSECSLSTLGEGTSAALSEGSLSALSKDRLIMLREQYLTRLSESSPIGCSGDSSATLSEEKPIMIPKEKPATPLEDSPTILSRKLSAAFLTESRAALLGDSSNTCSEGNSPSHSDYHSAPLSGGSLVSVSEENPATSSERRPATPLEITFTPFIDQSSPESADSVALSESSQNVYLPSSDKPPHACSVPETEEETPSSPSMDPKSPFTKVTALPEPLLGLFTLEPLSPFIRKTKAKVKNLAMKLALDEMQLSRLTIIDTLSEVSEQISALSLDISEFSQADKISPSTLKADVCDKPNSEAEDSVTHPPIRVRKMYPAYLQSPQSRDAEAEAEDDSIPHTLLPIRTILYMKPDPRSRRHDAIQEYEKWNARRAEKELAPQQAKMNEREGNTDLVASPLAADVPTVGVSSSNTPSPAASSMRNSESAAALAKHERLGVKSTEKDHERLHQLEQKGKQLRRIMLTQATADKR